MEPTSRLSEEAGMQDDSTTNNHNALVKVNYILCCNERKMGPNISTFCKILSFGDKDESKILKSC